MRRRTAVLASAILAIGGFGIPSSFAQQQQQQNTGQTSGQTGRTSGQGLSGQSTNTNHAATGDRTGVNANRPEQQAELKGVQSLFAEATDAAVMRDGLQRMAALFAPEGGAGATGATGASGLNHGTYTPGAGSTGSGTSGIRSSSGTSGVGSSSGTSASRTGSSSGTSGTSGASGSSGIGGTSSGTASHTGTGTGATGAGTSGTTGGTGATGGNAGLASSRTGPGNADTQKLNQMIDEFNRDWKQKYSRDFRISDPSLVFADITANDIMAGQAQPAGERLPGSGTSGTSGSTSGTSSGTSGTSTGTSGSTSGSSGTSGGSSSGTSGSSGASGAAGSSGQSSSGAGSASDRTTGTSGAGFSDHGGRVSSTGNLSTGTGAAGAGANMMGREISVNVPPVQGSQAVTVRLVRMGQDNFRFASSGGMVDQQRLASALETHIKHVMDQKDRWPTDAAQAQRLVTQHVLMAVSEASNAAGENAQPAGLHLPGHNGANDTGNTTPGSHGSGTSGTGNTSGSGNTGSGTSGSRTGGTSGTGGAGR